MHHATQANLSRIPQGHMDEAMAGFRASFASRRFRFMLRHNPAYFLTAVKEPKQFFGSLSYLIKNWLNTLMDSANGKASKVSRLQRLFTRKTTPSLAVKET